MMFRRIVKDFTSIVVRSRFCIYNAKTAYKIKFTNKFQSNVASDGTLVEMSDATSIRDYDDKYGLSEIRDAKVILTHLSENMQKYELNDLIYFMRRLVKIQEDHPTENPNFTKHNTFKELIKHVRDRFQSGNHEKYPFIGSYAYCLNKLNVRDHELWSLLEQKVLRDQFYTTFQESEYAVQGFSMIPVIMYGRSFSQIQQRVDKIYERLERIIRLTIWEVEVGHYQRISVALALVNRFDPRTFGKLEQHILTNLSLHYDVTMMIDILISFAKGGQGSEQFYKCMQKILVEGHMFEGKRYNKVHQGIVAKRLSEIIEIYNQVKMDNPTFLFIPDFRGLIYNQILNKNNEIDFETGARMLQSIETFEFEDQKFVQAHILERLQEETNKKGYDPLLQRIQTQEIKRLISQYGLDQDQNQTLLPQK